MSKYSFLTKTPKQWSDFGLLIFRVGVAFLLLYGHGFDKLSTILSGQEIQFFDPIGIGANTSYYLAAFAEGICAILLIFGLFSRYASLILVINFLVIVYAHKFLFQEGFDILELRYFYLLSFVVLTLLGPGGYSLDQKLFGNK